MFNPKVFLSFIVLIQVFANSNGKDIVQIERIVGGEPTTIEKYPYQVSLRKNDGHICGGALIRCNVILTAAHCVHSDLNPGLYSVLAGATNVNAESLVTDVKRIVPHRQYNTETLENDIALVFLDCCLPCTRHIDVIDLPYPDESVFDINCDGVITGWGALTEGGSAPEQLHVAKVPITPPALCKQNYPGQIFNGMICAGTQEDGIDTCQGDSGGPLVGYNDCNSPTLFGVTSWGEGCARPGKPGVYTSVSYYIKWIERILRRYG